MAMVNVKMLVATRWNSHPISAGSILEVADDITDRWIDRGIAALVEVDDNLNDKVMVL